MEQRVRINQPGPAHANLKRVLPACPLRARNGQSPTDPFTKHFLEQIGLAGGASGIEIKPVALARGVDDLDAAFVAFADEKPDTLILQGIYSLKASPISLSGTVSRLPRSCLPCAGRRADVVWS